MKTFILYWKVSKAKMDIVAFQAEPACLKVVSRKGRYKYFAFWDYIRWHYQYRMPGTLDYFPGPGSENYNT
jgi:hypothetical protein